MSALFYEMILQVSSLYDVACNGGDKWYAIGGYEDGVEIDSVLLIEISQVDFSLNFKIFKHSSAPAFLQGHSVVVRGGEIFIGAVTAVTAWTADGSWKKLLFLKVQPSDFSVSFSGMLGKSGIHDTLDEIAISSDAEELYFNSGRRSFDLSNYNCQGSMAKLLVNSEILAWQKKILASDPTNQEAVFATDVELHNNDVYFTFMYGGDCLIIVLDTSGNEVAKKQFGLTGEKDIISELLFDS